MTRLVSQLIIAMAVILSLEPCASEADISENFEKLSCYIMKKHGLQVLGSSSITLRPNKSGKAKVEDCMRACNKEPFCRGFEYHKISKKCAWKQAAMPLTHMPDCQIDFYRFKTRACKPRPESASVGCTEQTFELPKRVSHPLLLSHLKFSIFTPSWGLKPLNISSLPQETRDYILKPNPAEHLVDLEVKKLYTSPHRTHDPDEAQFVVIDAPVISTKVFNYKTMSHKARKEMWDRYTTQLVDELRMTIAWKQRKPHHLWYGMFTFVQGFGRITALGIGPTTPLTLIATDVYPLLTRKLAMPYVRQAIVPFVHTWRYTLAASVDIRRRPYDVVFRGNLHRTHDGQYREGLLKLRDELIALGVSTNITDGDFKHFGGLKAMVDETVDEVRHTKLCLIPAGDTPSSRRVYDALAGGCIPVIMSKNIEQSLPFRSMIKWRSIALFFNTMLCVSECSGAVAQEIQKLLKQPDRLRTMQQRGAEVFNKYLKYDGPVASASIQRTYDETVVGLDWLHHPLFTTPGRWHPAHMSAITLITDPKDGRVRGAICNAVGLPISSLRALALRISTDETYGALPKSPLEVYPCSGDHDMSATGRNHKAAYRCSALLNRRTMVKALLELADDPGVPMAVVVRDPVFRFLSASTNHSNADNNAGAEIALLRRFVEQPRAHRHPKFQLQADLCGVRYYPMDLTLRYLHMEMDIKRSRDRSGNGDMSDAPPPKDRDPFPGRDTEAVCGRLRHMSSLDRHRIFALAAQAYAEDYAAYEYMNFGRGFNSLCRHKGSG